uniref:Uncharacterized protein n=1 Tax=Myoviridae sp. ctWb16 TaxID=2827690 RepID=A0A8S5T0H1_9CAUD|nr:MAG TPA: hypothetical protein [Myoviridae sp. ctWb16]
MIIVCTHCISLILYRYIYCFNFWNNIDYFFILC